MNDHTLSPNLKEESNQLKEKIYKEASTKRNIWVVDVDIRKQHDLTFMEAALFGMVSQLQCVKEGFCRAKNYYFLDALGVSDEWMRVALKKLSAKGLIWYHVYNTKNGKRRHIVTASSIRSYQRYLASHKSWTLLKKFQKEFVVFQPHVEPSDPPSSSSKKETQVADNLPPPEDSYRPSGKSGDGPPKKSLDAINTTYLPDNQNDGTCKSSDELSVAVSFEEKMRKELEESYSREDVDIMMQWYEMQTDAKKATMKKPIACVINAHKGGYAQEEVASKNIEIAEKIQEKKAARLQKEKKKEEEEKNKKFAHHLIKKFSHLEEWSHSTDSKTFSILNVGVTKGEETVQGTGCLNYYILPSGEKRYGSNHFVRVSFEQSHIQFTNQLKNFFNETEWKISYNQQELIG
jgi:hypothetical protein